MLATQRSNDFRRGLDFLSQWMVEQQHHQLVLFYDRKSIGHEDFGRHNT